MIRLLEPVRHQFSSDASQLSLLGLDWTVCEYADLSDAPSFTCISYSWGDEWTANPLCPEHVMSSRTIRAIEAAINASRSPENWTNNIKLSRSGSQQVEAARRAVALEASQAFWIDALCVPINEPDRTICLQQMGEIFGSAVQVVAVLGNKCSDAIQVASRHGQIGPDDLLELEQEDWVSRAWTYQEAVNSRNLYFVAEGARSEMVSGHKFLNAVMIAIDEYKLRNEIDDISWEKGRAQLRSLERLLADYLISDYETRSAYQVMSVMDQRISERPEDHFYAMVGSISATVRINGDEELSPSEYFMRACERKADFSFIYSTAPRSRLVGRNWRPVEGRFPPVLPNLITFGNRELGTACPTHVSLENMYRLQRGSVGAEGLKSARWFGRTKDVRKSPEEVASSVLDRLRTLGFTGSGEYLEFETGFFFPQLVSEFSGDVIAVVSSAIHWVTGGPGLLLRISSSGIHEFRDVGAFVGKSPKSGNEIKLG